MTAEEPPRGADRLPNLRPGGEPPPPERLPRQRRGTAPQMRSRFPDHDVVAHADHWDPVTRRTVLGRLRPPEGLRFFTPAEARTLTAFCDVVLAQDEEPRVPVLSVVDGRMADGRLDGYRYADMPEDPETWRLVARGLDEQAGGDFAALPAAEREDLVGRFATGDLHGGTWDEVPCSRAWSVVMRATLAAFYSHPWAFNEIGYGGPRYPRGYMRFSGGQREPDEAPETFAMDPVQDVRRRFR